MRFLSADDPTLLATGYEAPSTASSNSSCMDDYYASTGCERVLNETDDNVTKQDAIKSSFCDAGAPVDSVQGRKCAAAMAKLEVLQEIWQNQSDLCQTIPQPCSGATRGTCNATSGECICKDDWMGLQCEIQPSAVYWDTECGCFKDDGCAVYGLDENGGALTG